MFYFQSPSVLEMNISEALLHQQYKELLTYLYQNDTPETYQLVSLYENQFHIPIYYYLVRHKCLNGFQNENEIVEALNRSLKAIGLAFMHVSECFELNKIFALIEILAQKFQEKLYKYVTKEIFQQSVAHVIQHFNTILHLEYDNLNKHTPFQIIPPSEWIYKVSIGGWCQPALDCQAFLDKKELKSVQEIFSYDIIYNYNKHILAYSQFYKILTNISQHFQQTNTFDLYNGFMKKLPQYEINVPYETNAPYDMNDVEISNQ